MTIRSAMLAIFCSAAGLAGIVAALLAIYWVAIGGMTVRAWLACAGLLTTVFAYALVIGLGCDIVRASRDVPTL